MADKQLLALGAVGALAGGMAMLIEDSSGNTRYVTLDDLKTFFNTNPTVVPSSVSYRGAQVLRSSDQTGGAANTVNVIAWQTENRDTDGFWQVGAPTRFTIPNGITKIRLTLGIRYVLASTNTATRQIGFYKNGTLDHPGLCSTQANGLSMHLTCVTDVLDVVAGDYFEAWEWHSTSSQDVNAHGRTFFALEVIEASV